MFSECTGTSQRLGRGAVALARWCKWVGVAVGRVLFEGVMVTPPVRAVSRVRWRCAGEVRAEKRKGRARRPFGMVPEVGLEPTRF